MEQKLKIGDILLFKPKKHSWIGKCIAKLTNSDVSHAVMVYGPDSMIEMNADGVGVYGIDQIEGDEVYVMRMHEPPDPELLIKSANSYLKAEVRYDFPALVILAGLLVYRRTVPSKIAREIIELACNQLDHWMQQAFSRGAPVMVCSQLVYQIYENCGPRYHIQIKEGILKTKKPDREADFCDIDGNDVKELLNLEELTQKSEALAKELFAIIDSFDEEVVSQRDTPMHREYEKRFIDIIETLELKITPESLFTTPGDLLKHAQNLDLIGMCGIRIKA